MTLDDLQSAIRGAHDVKPAPLTDADVAPKRSPLSTFVPGTQTNPILLPEQTITATPENDLTQDDIERVLSLAMTGGDEELPKDGRWQNHLKLDKQCQDFWLLPLTLLLVMYFQLLLVVLHIQLPEFSRCRQKKHRHYEKKLQAL